MYLIIVEEESRLVNVPNSFLGALRPLPLSFERKAFSFCVQRDRWDKGFFALQGG